MNLLLSITLVLFSLYASSSPNPLLGPGAVRTTNDTHTYVVSIQKTGDIPVPLERHVCNGALITSRHVLTAAHCLDGFRSASDVRVMLGSNCLLQGKLHKVQSWITFDSWTKSKGRRVEFKDNDVAVVKLKKKIKDSNVRVAALSPAPIVNFFESSATMVSWGATNYNNATPPFTHAGRIHVLSNEECKRKIRDAQRGCMNFIYSPKVSLDSDRYLCSVGETDHVLMGLGDDGGVLLDDKNFVVGINIASIPMKSSVVPEAKVNVHLGIDYYREFIKNVMADICPKD